ncbi:AhpD family alkylhydroperoxidase [Inquilinus ginsengisoli]|uniref:AhpD family alkylhydroperoxidase n=1 Tax=Inquilinus ginsengisoli TaxID=363840 RepID=A0ABU1JIE6_9PROT|nr:carboxymuconolactone decarboxylase family protein [Inquilinus ginsengisoli]MDR6288385.1 AhpD family alkylhydroperoxidase [Inquilinus ginsengisoli]
MTPRLNIFQVAPEGTKAMMAVGTAVENSGLEHSLIQLVKLRASQINGCAFCIHMHATDAVKHGESPMRIHLLDAWRESPVFTDRERAALAWTESLTKVAETGAPDADYAVLKGRFGDTEIGNLTLLIGTINLWNRVQVGLRAIPKVDVPAKDAA